MLGAKDPNSLYCNTMTDTSQTQCLEKFDTIKVDAFAAFCLGKLEGMTIVEQIEGINIFNKLAKEHLQDEYNKAQSNVNELLKSGMLKDCTEIKY